MSRRKAKIGFAINLALLAVFSLACVASQFVGFSAGVFAGGRGYVLDTVRGEISLWTAAIQSPANAPPRSLFYSSANSLTVREIFEKPRNPIDRAWLGFGFGYARGTELYFGPPVRAARFSHVLVLPYWFMIMVTSLWPVVRIVQRLDAERTRRRLLMGKCPRCGYDLRATKMRCPECGSDSPFASPDSAPTTSSTQCPTPVVAIKS